MSSLIPKHNNFWRSLSELENDPKFVEYLEREFPEQASELSSDPLSRRRFMKLMGASLAFAGVAGCRWEKEEIVPLSRRPEGYIPGVPKRYATAMELGGVAAGLLVTSYDGRPIKIEGNAEHPYTGGRTTAFAQASVLGLYDPDRSTALTRQQGPRALEVSWAQFDAMATGLEPQTRLRVLSGASSSPTLRRLRNKLSERFSTVKWHEWEPLSRDNEREGTRMAFGEPLRVLPQLDGADTIIAIDSDVLIDHPGSLRHARDFARRRRPEDGLLSRVYAVESRFSSTGAVADHRLPLRAELMLPFLQALEAKLDGSPMPNAAFLNEPKVKAFLEAIHSDLSDAAGRRKSVVVVGAHQPPAVHALAARINTNSQATNLTVSYARDPDPGRDTYVESLVQLVTDINAGEVDALFILGCNPAYDAPADIGFAQALAVPPAKAGGPEPAPKVPLTVHLSEYRNETTELCRWHLPQAHYLESWGDARAWDGTLTIQQPLIEPLHEGRSAIQVVAALVGEKPGTGLELVRKTFSGDDAEWRAVLHSGHVPGSQLAKGQPGLKSFDLPVLTARQSGGTKLRNGELEVVFTPSSHTYDGRFANNAWLQETPDFMTKLVWDNAALISPATADELGIENEDLIKLRVGAQEIELAAYVMPGQAPYSIALALGHGRTRAGAVGGWAEKSYQWDEDAKDWVLAMSEEVPGFDVYPLRVSGAMDIAVGATVTKVGTKYPLASTQDHWAIDARGRDQKEVRVPELVRSARKSEYESADFGYHPHGPPLESLFEHHEELGPQTTGHRWAMATDLSTCIGCNACMLACQAENNVPVVGKREVQRSREMHWIRIDRYFAGDPDDPTLVHQPLTCQQCESAPCEQVCPVGATIHSDEGLNDMVYNRCVGTRYCLNNCPYKVRRFNFFNWHKFNEFSDPQLAKNRIRELLFNPEVTVRSRGVMEKCTYCVQRIEAAKIESKNKGGVPIKDGSFTTACAQACPTDAIVFGDLADPDSRVSKLHKQKRKYFLLAELNNRPRNAFLARITNPNEKLAPPAENKQDGHH